MIHTGQFSFEFTETGLIRLNQEKTKLQEKASWRSVNQDLPENRYE